MYNTQQTQHASQNDASVIVLRLPEVLRKTGLSRSTIYAEIANGTFPKQISLSARAVGWLASEIDAWLHDRVRARG
jgi:prophage regulatory protein